MRSKQTNTRSGLKWFLRPTWGKLTASIIFLLICLLLPLLGMLLKLRFVIIFWLVIMVIASFPFYPIIKALGLTTTSPIYFDMGGGPTPFGLLLIALFWVIILYLISCLVVYLRRGKDIKEQYRQKKIITKKEPKVRKKPSNWWYLLPILLSVIGGIIGYFLFRNRNKDFAKRLLIIGFIMFAVLIVLQIIFAGLVYRQIGGIQQEITKDTPPLRSNYFDYCWEYDCSAKIPYPKLENPSIPDDFVKVIRDTKAVGNLNAMVVFLYASDPLPKNKLNILKADETDIRSFKYAAKWFKDNALKYDVNLNLDIQFSSQQHKVPEEYIIHGYQESITKNLYQYIKKNLPQYSGYDVVIPFYYSSEDISFLAHASTQNWFTMFSKQVAPDTFYPSFKSSVYSSTFAHELSHVFGATDKYTCIPTSALTNCEYAKQKGIGCILESDNPNELGRDIMCKKVPINITGARSFFTPELNELVIIEATAKEFGWFDFDGDGIIEVEDPCPFSKENTC